MSSGSNPKAGEQNDPNSQSLPPSSRKTTCPKWRRVFDRLKLTGQLSKKPSEASREPSPPSQAASLIRLIQTDLDHMHGEARDLKVYNEKLSRDLVVLENVFTDIKKIKIEEDEKVKVDRLNKFRQRLMKVKLAIPSKYKSGDDKNSRKLMSEVERSICGEESKRIPQLHNSPLFTTSMEFKDFEARYAELDYSVKLCLLCFSIFPQGATIKRRLMLLWWRVEGFTSNEEEAQGHFKLLMEKGFIEAVNDNKSLSVSSCRIHPFHRSALVALAERAKLFNFGSAGDPTQSFSGSFQACLMGVGLISYEDFNKKNKASEGRDPVEVINELIQELEKLHLVMNVDEHILEFIGEWFGKMKNLNILYLGRWKALAIHHIEVEDPKFLEKLGNMKFLKFLSLQGVSNIISLPHSIQQLTNLDVLDLRACSNLESIPERIDRLQKLTHLDMSECYLLAHMPKALSNLTNLKVLKGFFVSKDINNKGCTLGELQKLEHLEKLCIYTDQNDFPQKEHVVDLEKLTALNKLTITWGVSKNASAEAKAKAEADAEAKAKADAEAKAKAKAEAEAEADVDAEAEAKAKAEAEAKAKAKPKPKPKPKAEAEAEAKNPPRLPPKLEKLDLKCFPMADTPHWLKLENMEGINLKKLYIRGGKLRDLGQYQGIDAAVGGEKKWRVEQLRLKYLGEIEMEWRQLQGLFPDLKYLEKVSCPNLTLFPCDAKGVWIKKP